MTYAKLFDGNPKIVIAMSLVITTKKFIRDFRENDLTSSLQTMISFGHLHDIDSQDMNARHTAGCDISIKVPWHGGVLLFAWHGMPQAHFRADT